MHKKSVIVVGGGFAGLSLIKALNLDDYHVTIVSPRNHFLFTPLLPSTTVGTVEFRSIIQPVRKARRGVEFLQAACVDVSPADHTIACRSVESDHIFHLPFHTLILAPGAVNNTFGIPGVAEHALFLKDLADARAIRERVIACLERADIPGIPPAEQERLLHFVVVGGGPTGVEFAAELHDLLDEDLAKSYPALAGKARITLFEAGSGLLTTFDHTLRTYVMDHFRRQGIQVRAHTPVRRVGPGFLELEDGQTVPAGLVVWSTGYGPTDLVDRLPFAKNKAGRLITDQFLRIPGQPAIYAAGDCSVFPNAPAPQTAQAAMQQGKYLARTLNALAAGETPKPFTFSNMGMMSYIGDNKALADIPIAGVRGRGFGAYLFWRSAYFTRLVSLKGKILVLFDWIKTALFGRDLSRF